MRGKLFALFMVVFSQTFAGERFVFTPINAGNGLSENRVRVISQLPDGRMVIVTEGLVNIYDGTHFNYIHFNDSKAYTLSNYTGFHHVYVDKDSHLWLKNYQKLLLFDISTESYIPELPKYLSKLGIHGMVSDFFMDSYKDFWFLLNDDRLLYRNNATNQIKEFFTNASKPAKEQDVLFDIAVAGNQAFLFYKSGLMICFNKSTGKEFYRDNPLRNEGMRDSYNTLMVATNNQFIYTLYNNSEGGILFRFNSGQRKWEQVIRTKYWLNTITLDSKGTCLVSSAKGIWQISANLESKSFLSKLQLVDGEIFETEISTQYNDNTGGLWVGTYDRGILYYHPERYKFKNYGRSYFTGMDNEEIRILSIIEYNNILYAGTSKGLFEYSREKQQYIKYEGIPSNTRCNMLYRDSNSRLWICAGQDGLYILHGKDVKHFQFSFTIQSLYEKAPGIFYLFTNAGAGIFNPETGIYKAFENINIDIGILYQVVSYKQDSLLGISSKGIIVINPTLNLFSFADKGNPMFKNHNHQYNSVFTDSRKWLWFGTQDGLFVWDTEKRTGKTFWINDGLINNCIYSIVEDNAHRIWVSTANGISRIEIFRKGEGYEFLFTGFNQFDGIIKNEFMPRSVCITKDQRVLWGGLDGINEIELNTVDNKSRLLSAPLFTKFFISGIEVGLGKEYEGRVLLKESMISTKEIRLKHNQNYLAIEFSALNYINPAQTYYRYKLDGLETSWNIVKSADGRGKAIYTNLQPGSYRLIAEAADNTQKWISNNAVLQIVIEPPFWKTSWAYMVYIILFFGVLYIGILRYTRSNRIKMEQKQKEELDQLKMAFFTNISHELRTPLTLILTPLSSVIKRVSDGQLKLQLENIYRNANELLNQVNHLLDFRKLEARGEYLQPSYCNMGEFIGLIISQFSDIAKEKSIRLDYLQGNSNINAFIDKDKFRIILNNLLSNAIKYTPENGTITVTLNKGDINDDGNHTFLVKVADTGFGIPESDLPKIFERFYQVKSNHSSEKGSGIGLYLSNEYAKMHRGKIEVKSETGVGSTFMLTIPVNVEQNGADAEKTEPDAGNKALTVLIVEDNAEFREFLRYELSNKYSVLTAQNGREGLEKVLESIPDMVISDVMMPELSGIDMCKLIKSDVKVSHIPVILLTARASDMAQIEGYRGGADDYITKPFNMELLHLRIGRLLELQQQRKELFKKSVLIDPDKYTTNHVDEEFIRRAIGFIERNITNPSYLVEELSRDMCMDRSGLYRKLTAILGQKPSSFIRSIRLKHAAKLITQGISVSEVSDMVGYSTVSYFSRCFQEEFGVPPSQYKV